jgi:hypothetical protein
VHTALYINDTLIKQQNFSGPLGGSEVIEKIEFNAFGTWDEIQILDSEPEPPSGTVIYIH